MIEVCWLNVWYENNQLIELIVCARSETGKRFIFMFEIVS